MAYAGVMQRLYEALPKHCSTVGAIRGSVWTDHAGLVAETPDTQTISIDATYVKAHRTASSLGREKEGHGRLIGRTKGGMNKTVYWTGCIA